LGPSQYLTALGLLLLDHADPAESVGLGVAQGRTGLGRLWEKVKVPPGLAFCTYN
jgi:hypothetical protein